MKRRVVVTGSGMVSPLGVGVEENWDAICNGKSGIGLITRFDVEGFPVRIAGEVDGFEYQITSNTKSKRKWIASFILLLLVPKWRPNNPGLK